MSPPNKEVTGSQLPPPMPEKTSLSAGDNVGEGLNANSERPAGAERASAPSAAPSLSTIPLPTPPPTAVSANPAAPVLPVQNSVLAADDNDLIEKEWVNKAKQIVERTRDDPYKQSEDLTIFKADYLKRRYGKTIKVSQ